MIEPDGQGVRGSRRRAGGWRRAGCGLAAALLLAGCNAGGSIVPPNEGFAIKVNMLCTTCDDFLDCRREPPPPAPAGPAVREPLLIYRLKEKSFWAQIATIGDYLFQFFRQKQTDERPLAIYRDDGSRRTIEQLPTRARIDGVAGTITLPDGVIDLRSGAWFDVRGERLGSCRALLRRDGYALMREFLGRAPAPGTAGKTAGPAATPAATPPATTPAATATPAETAP